MVTIWIPLSSNQAVTTQQRLGDHFVSTLQILCKHFTNKLGTACGPFLLSPRGPLVLCWTPFFSSFFLLLLQQFPLVPHQCDTYTPPHARHSSKKFQSCGPFQNFFSVLYPSVCPQQFFLLLCRKYFYSPNISPLLQKKNFHFPNILFFFPCPFFFSPTKRYLPSPNI